MAGERRRQRRMNAGADVSPDIVQGATYAEDGRLVVDQKALAAIRAEQGRGLVISSVPSVPQNIMRNAGGAGVERGHSSYQLPIVTLRDLRERSPILNPIHAARRAQTQRMSQKWSGRPGEVGWHVYHKDFYDPTVDAPASIRPFIRAFEDLLSAPSPSYGLNCTADLLVPLMEDYLTVNRPVVEVLDLALAPDVMAGFKWVDGGQIWPTLTWLEKWKRDEGPNGGRNLIKGVNASTQHALELASIVCDYDLFGVDYVLVRNGMMERGYPRGRLIVAPELTRTDVRYAGYPPSKVEEAMSCVVAGTDAWAYNHNFFKHGWMAEQVFAISGDYSEQDVQALMGQFRDRTMGVDKAHEPLFLPLGSMDDIKAIPMREHGKDMAFETWFSLVANLACAIYRMDPSTVNIKPWGGGASSSLSEPSRNQEITLAKEEGLQSALLHLTNAILMPLAKRVHPDLRVRFEYGDFDPLKRAQVDEIRVRTLKTRNELRMETGDSTLGFFLTPDKYDAAGDEDKLKHDSNPWNWPNDPGFATAMAAKLNPPPKPVDGGVRPGVPGGRTEDPEAEPLAKGHQTVYSVVVNDVGGL